MLFTALGKSGYLNMAFSTNKSNPKAGKAVSVIFPLAKPFKANLPSVFTDAKSVINTAGTNDNMFLKSVF